MKKILFLLLFFIITGLLQAQTAPTTTAMTPTTEEEYNMGAVGYRLFLQMGVELKKGYKVNDIATYEYGERKSVFKGLYRSGDQKPCAIIMVYTKLRGAPEYYCMPTVDAPEILWDRFRMSLAGETDNLQEQLQFFGFVIAKGMMLFATK
ncbi:hypothetical protein BH11BAC2_BH11BAC2_22050 [soil metagenome]